MKTKKTTPNGTTDYTLTTTDYTRNTDYTRTTDVDRLRADAVRELRELQEGIVQDVSRAVHRAIRAGELLTGIRETFPKRAEKGGGFYGWIAENLHISKSTAIGYMRAWRDRDLHLDPSRADVNANVTVAQLFGYKTANDEVEEAERVDDDEARADIAGGPDMYVDDTPTESNDVISRTIYTLTPAQESRARKMAQYFAPEYTDPPHLILQLARRREYLRATEAMKRPKVEAEPSTLVKKTIRYSPEVDGYIQHVAKTTGRKYNEVNTELVEIGLTRFKKRYALR